MDHIAIDLGSQESQVCVRGPDGAILEEREVAKRRRGTCGLTAMSRRG
jgi:hypothetical protein